MKRYSKLINIIRSRLILLFIKRRIRRQSIQNNIACENLTPYINKPGIVLSFDDGHRVKCWYKYGLGKKIGFNNIFGYFEVKVTFNINAYNTIEGRNLTQEEIDMLIEMQSYGHEIVHHGYKHERAVNFLEKKTKQQFINNEIVTLIEWLRSQGHSVTGDKFKELVSYVYPGDNNNIYTDNILVPNFFKIARTGWKNFKLTPFEYTGSVSSVCIDERFINDIKLIKPLLRLVKKSGKNIVFQCHSILPKEENRDRIGRKKNYTKASMYRISPEDLEFLINEAKGLDLEFYTLAELSGVASFIDKNFENSVRNLLSLKPDKNKWIMIRDLIAIERLNLSNKGIHNLAGIEYFLHLQELDLSFNNINDLKILYKLKELKKINIKGNAIYDEYILKNLADKGCIVIR